MQFYSSLEVATYDQAINSQSPPLATIKAELGEQQLLAILTLIIADAVEFFNIGKSMTGEQIVSTAKLIAKDYYYLKPEDFKLCFDNAKRGKYGKLFDRLDGMIIMEWLETYSGSRANRAEEINTEKHNEGKAIDNRVNRFFQQRRDNEAKEMHRIQVEQFRRETNNNKPAA